MTVINLSFLVFVLTNTVTSVKSHFGFKMGTKTADYPVGDGLNKPFSYTNDVVPLPETFKSSKNQVEGIPIQGSGVSVQDLIVVGGSNVPNVPAGNNQLINDFMRDPIITSSSVEKIRQAEERRAFGDLDFLRRLPPVESLPGPDVETWSFSPQTLPDFLAQPEKNQKNAYGEMFPKEISKMPSLSQSSHSPIRSVFPVLPIENNFEQEPYIPQPLSHTDVGESIYSRRLRRYEGR